MDNTSSHDLFPLPLVPFESYMMVDDRPKYPMTFVLCMRLEGQMDRRAWEGALQQVLPRHPFLVAHIRRVRRKGLCWVLAEGNLPWINWDREGVKLSCPDGEWIDLARETGLRMWVRQGADAVELTTQFHHACCDGVGALRFLGDAFAAYAAQTGDTTAPRLLPLISARLLERDRFDVPVPDSVSRWRVVSILVRETWRMLVRRPVPLAASAHPASDEAVTAAFPHFYTHTFDAGAFRGLRAEAKRREATLNDLMMCALFQTLRQWNMERGHDREQNWLRVNMPTDLRTRADGATPAANRLGYAFLTRRFRDCRETAGLLATIREETRAIRHWRLGTLFLEAVRLGRSIPLLLPLTIGRRRCHTTTVFTNLGDPSRRFSVRFPRKNGRVRLGNLLLEQFTGVPPLREQTRAVFGVAACAGRLSLSIRSDAQAFSAADTQALLAMLVDELYVLAQQSL